MVSSFQHSVQKRLKHECKINLTADEPDLTELFQSSYSFHICQETQGAHLNVRVPVIQISKTERQNSEGYSNIQEIKTAVSSKDQSGHICLETAFG